jgi:hypothetical protein
MTQAEAKQAKAAPIRPPAEVEADLVATRERLVGTISQLEERVKPANVANRGKDKVKAFYTDDSGGMRWDRVAMTAGGVVAGLIGLRMVSSTVRWAFAAPSTKPVPADVVYVPVPRGQVAAVSAML